MAIKAYADLATYNAATKSTTESNVSLLENTNEVIIDGVNVVTDSPAVGDLVVADESNQRRFIAFGTYQAATFPAAWEIKGVVVLRHGKRVHVMPKTYSTSVKMMPVYPWIVTGYTLDGTDQTASIILHSADAVDFTYNATTVEDFVSQLSQWLTDNSFSDWSCYLKDSEVWLQYNNYTSADTSSATGLTLTAKVAIDYGDRMRGSNTYRNGVDGWQWGWNYQRLLEYARSDMDDTNWNPSSVVTRLSAITLLCLPAYLGTSQYRDGDMCEFVRSIYGEGEEGWKAYMWDATPDPRSTLGLGGPLFRDSRDINDICKNVTYIDTDGNEQYLYTAYHLAATTDCGLEGMEAGDFFLPSPPLFCECFGNVTRGLSGVTADDYDDINKSLSAIGGTPVPASGAWYWLAAFGSRGYSWRAYSNGRSSGNSLYGSNRAVPLSLLELD